MLGLASLTVRRRSASLLATATRQAGGGGRLRGLESPAKMGASGMRSPLRPGFTPFFLPSGGKRAPFCSGVPPNKTDCEVLMKEMMEEMMKEILSSKSSLLEIHGMLKRQHSSIGIASKAVGAIVMCYAVLHLAYVLGAMSSERMNHFAKTKIHELSRDEDVLKYVDFVAQRAADTFMKRINPQSPVMERWTTWGAGKAAPVQIESAWVTHALTLAVLLQEMSKHGMELKEETIVHLSIGHLGYKQELVMDILGALVLIGFVKGRAGKKGDGKILEMSKSSVSANLLSDQEFVNKLIEAEKAK